MKKLRRKKVQPSKFELSPESFFLPNKISQENQRNLESFRRIYWRTRERLLFLWKKEASEKEIKISSRFEHICSESCSNLKAKKLEKIPYRVSAIPLEKSAIKHKTLGAKSKRSSKKTKKELWPVQEFKPFDGFTTPSEVIPTSEPSKTCVLSEREKKLPEYWKDLKSSSKYSATSLHKVFNEKFSEYDVLHYSIDDDFSMKYLKNQYFENYLSEKELEVPINRELAPIFNSLNKLLNEQPFLVLPIRPSALIYSLLPELDGIHAEFKKYKIDRSKSKRVSLKDVWVQGKGLLSKNLLSFSPSVSYFSTSLIQSLNRREWRSFAKVREFDINDFSLTCYSAMNPFTSSSNDRLLKLSEKLTRKVYWRGKLTSGFLITNNALEWEGEAPNFEREVLMDNYEFTSFSQPSFYWAKEYQNSLPNKNSVRVIGNKRI
ncbi:hypothetical protein [Mycoplasma suis]|uniref:Uncharacterized protein n=2 Tax=Mycoplasma suis TaxID=57372 RepID=F0QQ49_MYCSL|nr:hypothetical protein [Mycoplasma suis]ADX97619.1 hypothetical protein MSU_0075 [Mycoplasma suis str. Illinois]CBZ40154.1 hypothetical protein MSUIS_00610 [Mycoplasma suis KI3806]